ncbi:MAG: MobA/MobL family protein, partial [Hyphomicrobium sp.]|nr:MobA/MobL family protein [Hyphomicrobium sp.]
MNRRFRIIWHLARERSRFCLSIQAPMPHWHSPPIWGMSISSSQEAMRNAAEAAERRKDAQVAREIVLALPADRVLSTEDRIELAR